MIEGNPSALVPDFDYRAFLYTFITTDWELILPQNPDRVIARFEWGGSLTFIWTDSTIVTNLGMGVINSDSVLELPFYKYGGLVGSAFYGASSAAGGVLVTEVIYRPKR